MSNEIVLRVLIHCEGCKDKVSKCLRGLDGVCEVVIDAANHEVIVRGKELDPFKVLGKLKNKFSRNVELISHKPNHEIEEEKQQNNEEEQTKLEIVVLKTNMHCEACAFEIKRDLERMAGVMKVEANIERSSVTVHGSFEPQKLVEFIKKRHRRSAEIESQETLLCSSKMACCRPCALEDNYVNYSLQSLCFDDQMCSDENPLSCSLM